MLKFGGHDLTDIIKIKDIKKSVLPSRKNASVNMPSCMGEVYTGFKYEARSIDIEYIIVANTVAEYEKAIRDLAYLLDHKAPATLILGNESDKYYKAVVDGATELDQVRSTGSGTIKFICYDPLAYSTSQKLFTPNSKKIVTVTNQGTAEAYPLINVAFSKDASFLQCTNYNGKAVLVGSRPSADQTVVNASSSIVLNDPCNSLTNWTTATNVLDNNREVSGTVAVNGAGTGFYCSNYGSTTYNGWHGGAIRRNLTTSLKEFMVDAKIEHNSLGVIFANGNYIVNLAPSLRVRSKRDTTSTLVTNIPYNTKVTVSDIKEDWGKVTYNNKTGYVYMRYLTPVATTDTDVSAENRMGTIEVYGFDTNGQKLFKFEVIDKEMWYEYTQPQVSIGNSPVLNDQKNCPAPKTTSDIDQNGATTISSTHSGKFGDWNEFLGKITIRRKLNSQGSYNWHCQVRKVENGKTTQLISTSTLVNSGYPKGDLKSIVVFFGQHKDSPAVDTMVLQDLVVTDLSTSTPSETVNTTIFKAGDELEINNEEQKIYLNGEDYMKHLDIGSEFFSSGSGSSQFICQSDDSGIDVVTSIRERWL